VFSRKNGFFLSYGKNDIKLSQGDN
jgi:hypothetical protein